MIRDRFQFPSSVRIRVPDDDNRACHSCADEVCFYEVVVCCMVVWMFANDGDFIRIDEFLHFYRLRQFKRSGLLRV